MVERSRAVLDEAAHRDFSMLLEACLEKDRLSHLGKLVKGLIHNINGPLQNMSLLTEMLIKEHEQLGELMHTERSNLAEYWQKSHPKQQQRLQWLLQQISALGTMLRDFMVFQEIERSESEVDLHLALTKLVDVFGFDLFCKHHVRLELRLEDSVPLVRILGRHLIPALIHLLRNALIAVREAPVKKVVITCQRAAGSVRITFRDSGCGPDPACDAETSFALFQSAWPPTDARWQREDRNFGFGLFAARHLLQPYGVRIYLDREGEETLAVLEIPVQ